MKFIAMWNIGNGASYQIVECKNKEEAVKYATESAYEEVESEISYNALVYSDEQALGFSLELDDVEEL